MTRLLYAFLLLDFSLSKAGDLGTSLPTTIKEDENVRVRPNILFLMADQMRADVLGCAGSTVAKTPNLDWIASQGVRFKNSFTSTPSCTPARSAILTGLSPWYHGMLGYGVVANRYGFEMPRALSEGGYFTSSIGKDHFGWNSSTNAGISHGYDVTVLYDGLPEEVDNYDEWFMTVDPGVDPMATGLEFNDYRGAAYALREYFHPTAWVGREAVKFIENYNRSEPFFLKVSFHRPHSPYDPPDRWMEQFKPEDMPAPFTGGNWDTNYAIHYNGTPDPAIWCGDLGLKQVQNSRQAYYASVAYVDEWIGYILKALTNRSLSSETVILFTADHGDMIGDHYHWRKCYPYFGSARIPLLLSWPPFMDRSKGGDIAVPRGTVLSEVTELRDILPTFLDAAGLPVPESLNGTSLFSLLRHSEEPVNFQAEMNSFYWREYIDLEHNICYNVTNHWNALTDGHKKYIFRAFYGDEQLFDIDSDPEELYNLSNYIEWEDTLIMWRKRLIKQFETEGRGPEWVKDGELLIRKKGMLYSPHYPKSIND